VADSDSWGLKRGEPLTPTLTAIKLLGGGSAYEAYLCFDDTTYAPVVVKVVRPSQVTDRSTLRGLRREVQALDDVNHPVVVRGLRHSLEGDRPHVVLEQIDGPRLSSLIRRHGPLQEQQYLPLAIEIASAIHYFGNIGYVHLDIKPSNIIMGAPCRLIDLSVARTADRAAALTNPIGTDAYMAPEQCDPPNTGTPGGASDVWGLGATLFHAVAGYRPFDRGEPESEDVEARFPQLVHPPHDLPNGVPADVAKMIGAALAFEPSERPTPREFAEALEPVLAAQPTPKLGGLRMIR
jgi:eukaryotic-like serine/threonine-protein kinase